MTDFYLPGVPAEEAKKIAQAMQRPEGTVTYWGNYPELLKTTAKAGVLLRVVVGQLVFLLERDDSMILRFLQSSPSVGTREATIDLKLFEQGGASDRFFFALTWSPTETRVNIGPKEKAKLLEGVGKPAVFSLQVAENGDVVRIGDAGVSVAGVRMYSDGKLNVSPTAIKLWQDTRLAAETLLTGESEVGYLFETVTANAVFSTLVTGFEGYCQQRFIELEAEGIPADFEALVQKFLSQEEKDKFDRGEQLALEVDALARDKSRHRVLADRINFQSYEDSKRAFSRGYGIRFGELASISSQDLEDLQKIIRYRHRIIHVSPLLGLLNQPEVPREQPFFANKSTAEPAIKTFDAFIAALHATTLELRSD
jgi:hypothetical protein